MNRPKPAANPSPGGTGQKASIRLLHKVRRAAALLVCLLFMISCKASEETRSRIRINITEQETLDGTIVQIPEFVSDSEETRKKLRELERNTAKLKKLVEKEQKKGTCMEMRSYLNEEKGYPQVTVVWYLTDTDTRLYNLVTLGADEKEEAPITCKEALEGTGMSGVDLSLQVGRLAQESGIRGELTSTEMQGFRINENGETEEIYMKLTLRTVSTTENEKSEEVEVEKTEEHFFSYYPKEEKLVRLSELGFDIP